MKRILLSIITIVSLSLSSFAQAPEAFKYQAVVRDAGNLTIDNQQVGVSLTILQDSIGGLSVYSETFAPTTNSFGLVNLEIGTGISIDDFTLIDWANGPYFMETAVDLTGGTSYQVMGTSQLMSVPYALYAKTAGNSASGPQGTQGPQGDKGDTGDTGADGLVGAPGLDGSDATNYWTESGANVFRAAGFVGIGTTNPVAPLHVETQSSVSGYPNYTFYALQQSNVDIPACCAGLTDLVSIHATGRVMASEFDAFSDARIKNMVGTSNSNEDLSTLLAIEITDYTMKDKAKDHKPYKKVIAQQVESVYAQAVSKITDVVPDIYAVSSIKDGYISLETDLKKGDKVKLIFDEGAEMATVISTNANGFMVDLQKTGNVFVYGREVDDFRTVDYEAISMLNVSATQELYKLILKQQKTIENQKTEFSAQMEMVISTQKEITEEVQSDFDKRIKVIEDMFNITTLNK